MSRVERGLAGGRLLIVGTRVAPRAATTGLRRRSGLWGGLVHDGGAIEDGEGPAPAGEFAGDGDVGDDGPFLAQVEGDPSFVQSPIPGVAAGAGWRGASSQRSRMVLPGR